jgi:hypothetical protein
MLAAPDEDMGASVPETSQRSVPISVFSQMWRGFAAL